MRCYLLEESKEKWKREILPINPFNPSPQFSYALPEIRAEFYASIRVPDRLSGEKGGESNLDARLDNQSTVSRVLEKLE